MTSSLRTAALALLLECDADRKASGARGLDLDAPIDEAAVLTEPPGIPGRPLRPALVAHTQSKQRSVRTLEGRAALIHAIAHIELNAIELAIDDRISP